jgi:hypothetical protein
LVKGSFPKIGVIRLMARGRASCGICLSDSGGEISLSSGRCLAELKLGTAQSAELPSDDLCRVISELFDQDDFERYNERRANQGDAKPEYFADVRLALTRFNKLVQRAGLIAYLDESGRCYLRSTGTGMIRAPSISVTLVCASPLPPRINLFRHLSTACLRYRGERWKNTPLCQANHPFIFYWRISPPSMASLPWRSPCLSGFPDSYRQLPLL